MSTISQFEDIEAWQRARELTRAIYQVSSQGAFSRDYALRDQIRRAATSVMSNIAEGFERGGNREFRQFLSQAKGSVGEVRAQLYIAQDAGLISPSQFDKLIRMAIRTSQLIAGLLRYLEHSNLNGVKFREEEVTYDVER